LLSSNFVAGPASQGFKPVIFHYLRASYSFFDKVKKTLWARQLTVTCFIQFMVLEAKKPVFSPDLLIIRGTFKFFGAC